MLEFQTKTKPLSERNSKSELNKVMIDPDSQNLDFFQIQNPYNTLLIKNIAQQIKKARQNNKQVIIAFGAHLIKNGLSQILIKLIEKEFITCLATNGAGSIHDWEFAFQGKTEEDVRDYIQKGEFGLWEETGKFINQAVIKGAENNLGYGEAVGKIIEEESLGSEIIKHPYKGYSLQAEAYKHKIPFTVHPCLGQDIIHISPYCSFEAIGKCAQRDFEKFITSLSELEGGGLYISIGSAVMSPMVFEKSISVARNLAGQEGKEIKSFSIIVNDIQDSGRWEWGTGQEPPKSSPAYYLRFCKTFDRIGAKEMYYIQEDNRSFLLNLWRELRDNMKN